MNLSILDPYRWYAAGALVLALGGGFALYRHNLIEQGRDEVRAEVAQQALKQIERAQDATREMKGKADEATARYQEATAYALAADGRISQLERGMLKRTPSAQQLAGITPAALSSYAAETDRDFAECRGEYQALGRTAASASAAAWAYRESWPAYDEFQGRLTTFKNQITGIPGIQPKGTK